jgi:hypothetical protein
MGEAIRRKRENKGKSQKRKIGKKKKKGKGKRKKENKSGRRGSQGTLGWGFLNFWLRDTSTNHPLIVDTVEIGIPYHALTYETERLCICEEI